MFIEENEEWKTIIDFPNYMISNFGRVYNQKYNRFLNPTIEYWGYEIVSLSNNGLQKNVKVHRLVAEAFLEQPIIEAYQVNHIDGNKTNNYVSNLEWVTPSENILHAFRLGLSNRANKRPVRIIETGETFESLTECARFIGVGTPSVWDCLSGRQKTLHGLTLEYAD